MLLQAIIESNTLELLRLFNQMTSLSTPGSCGYRLHPYSKSLPILDVYQFDILPLRPDHRYQIDASSLCRQRVS